VILVPLPPEFRDYRCRPPYPAFFSISAGDGTQDLALARKALFN
jgi:hypothetical protein